MRVLSLIQPSGDIHLGNYLGAIRWWSQDQRSADSFFGLADLHALTTEIEPAVLRSKSLESASILLAAGLDPDVCTLFCQSHVPAHTELGWLMECTAGYGELGRMTQFKAKAAEHQVVTAGFFSYPALMAADILLYDADRVPVGDDQRQHLELTRDLAQRFNHRYGDTFVVPEAAVPRVAARVMDLQAPTAKMSKTAESTQGTILVLDDPATITRKIKRAVTDTETEVRYDRLAKPGVSNLLDLLSAATGTPAEELAGRYTQYGPLKTDTAEAVVELLRPVQDRYAALAGDPDEVHAVLAQGAEKAAAVAETTLKRARDAVGLLPRPFARAGTRS